MIWPQPAEGFMLQISSISSNIFKYLQISSREHMVGDPTPKECNGGRRMDDHGDK
jgi:hypothetical protein